MREKLKEFFAVPANIRQEFWQDTVQKNRLSLIVISIMIFGMELFTWRGFCSCQMRGLGHGITESIFPCTAFCFECGRVSAPAVYAAKFWGKASMETPDRGGRFFLSVAYRSERL